MMKKIIFIIGIITCLILVGLPYICPYIYRIIHREELEQSRQDQHQKKMEAKNNEMNQLLDRVLHYSKQQESGQDMSQKDLAQYVFFKNLDSELDEKVIISRAEQLLHTKLIDINAYNNRDQTALYVAAGLEVCANGCYDLVKLLLDHGANVNQYSQQGSQTALLSALLQPNIVELLFEYGADPNLPLYDGATVLMAVFEFFKFALNHEKPEKTIQDGKVIIELLLAHGADPMLADKNGKSAMDVLKETQEFYQTGKIKVGDQEQAAWFAGEMSEDRKNMLKALQEIEILFANSAKSPIK